MAKETHGINIVPEAWRARESKREGCSFRVNISRPPKFGIIYISKAILTHTHEVHLPSKDNAIGLEALTPGDIRMIQGLYNAGANLTSVMRVNLGYYCD